MLGVVAAHEDRIVAPSAEDQFGSSAPGGNDVVAVLAMQEADVVAVFDDVVAVTAAEGVDARVADQQVVASAAPERIVPETSDENIALVGSAEHDVLAAVELE